MSVRQSVLGVVAVLGAVAAVVVVGSEHPRPVVPVAHPVEQPLRETALSCPTVTGDSTPSSSVFAVGAQGADAPSPDEVDDHLGIVSRGTEATSLGSTSVTGRPIRTRLDAIAARNGVTVEASGALAPGAVGAEVSTYAVATERGLAATWCETSRGDWWFNGVDTSIGTSTRLVLTNPSPAVAVVDLRILGAHGVVDAAGDSGIAVAPRSSLVLDLARYAPGQPALTVHVSATSGTVAAALATSRLDGLTPAGVDWVPASAPPSNAVVVNAGVGGLGRQSLVITNPGTRQRIVSFRILDQNGAFSSTDLPDLQVAPGTVAVKDVSAILHKQTTGIELSAPGPVTGALVSRQVGGLRDFAVSGTTAPLTTATVVPVVNGAALTLSFATGRAGPNEVTIRAFNRNGAHAGSATVVANGAATTAWQPPEGWVAAYLVVSPPPDGDLHAVASYAGPLGVTQLPLVSTPRTVLRPGVLPF